MSAETKSLLAVVLAATMLTAAVAAAESAAAGTRYVVGVSGMH